MPRCSSEKTERCRHELAGDLGSWLQDLATGLAIETRLMMTLVSARLSASAVQDTVSSGSKLSQRVIAKNTNRLTETAD